MAISGISGLSYGMAYQRGTKDEIVSDGRVEERFVSSDSSFIREIVDPRIQSFCKTGNAPSADWKAHPLGGFDSPKQSLFIEEGQVVLRSNGEDNFRHLIKAPFDPASGAVNLEASTEGFDTAPETGKKTLVFQIPGGSDIQFGGVFNLDDPNALGNILK